MDLFGYNKSDKEITLENVQQVKGLKIFFDFISKDEEKELLANIENSTWLSDLKRRVQHYGYKYDYRARKIDQSYFIGEIPTWMRFLCDRLEQNKIIDFVPDQAIINEYIDDQGIAAHIDCEPCFGDTIISISLAGHCVMNFQREQTCTEQDKLPLLVLPRTLIVMTGESRYKWYHGIVGRKSDKFNGQNHKRQRRVSITFRKVILN
jgi:alkylated DNA repair dioxygenase AlkB